MDTLQALLSGLGEEYGDLNGKLNNCNGYLNEAARIMNDNLKGQWKTFSSEMEGVKIAIGERLAPILKNVMEKINAKIPEIKTKITTATIITIASIIYKYETSEKSITNQFPFYYFVLEYY